MITPDQEKNKYERMWAVKDYRANSPGERLLPIFAKRVSFTKGESILDIGCGTGRASLGLKQLGLEPWMLDITETALDLNVKGLFTFVESCLWLTPLVTGFDWFYCTDVLEHIPPEHVDAALKNIAMMTEKGGFFQIAMFQEAYGDYIGETLHLTLESSDWWAERLRRYWTIQWCEVVDRRLIAVVAHVGGAA